MENLENFEAFAPRLLNVHELRKRKAGLKSDCTAMIDAGVAAGKDLTAIQQKKYDAVVAEIREIDATLEEHAALAYQAYPAGAPVYQPNAQRGAFGQQLRDAYARASSEVRAQIDALGLAIAGRVRAAADLRPSGDGAVIIPSIIQDVIERNYAAFSPVVSIARLFPTDNGETTTFPVISDSESAVQVASHSNRAMLKLASPTSRFSFL